MVKLVGVLAVLGLGLLGCVDSEGTIEPLVEVSNEEAEVVEVIESEEEGLDVQKEVWEEIDEETGKEVKVESTKNIKEGKVISETLIREEIEDMESEEGAEVGVEDEVGEEEG